MNTSNTKELADQLEDLLNNFSCSCLKTHCLYARCKVSIEQSKELLQKAEASGEWVSSNDPV